MAAIVSATALNAEILGWQDRVGTIGAGKLADLIAVPAIHCRTSRASSAWAS
jgi:imidazolonepropionase-like amidohydrolase